MKLPNISPPSTLVSRGFVSFVEHCLTRHDGQTLHYTSLKLGGDSVVILARDKERRWIFNREYRYPAGDYLLGCPAGRMDPQETPEEAARRELEEETGYRAEHFVLLGSCFVVPALCDQVAHFFFADGAESSTTPQHDLFEVIEPILKTDEELQADIQSGNRIDSALLAAYGYWTLRRSDR